MVQAALILSALLAAPALAFPLGEHIPVAHPNDLHASSTGLSHHHAREFVDIDDREPIFGFLVKGAAKIAKKIIKSRKAKKAGRAAGRAAGNGASNHQQQKRELNDDELELIAREIMDVDWLEAREPIFGFLIKGAAKIAKKAIKSRKARKAGRAAGRAAGNGASNYQQQKRELSDDELELIARDVIDEIIYDELD